MNEYEKILELLDKETLTDDEQQYLSNSLNNPEAKKIKDVYLRLKKSLSLNNHIDEELMAEYVLYKNSISSNIIIEYLSGKIEAHFRNCSDCQKLLADLNSEYLIVDDFIENTITTKPEANKLHRTANLENIFKFNKFKYVFVTLASLAIIYFGLLFVSSVTTPDYKKTILNENDFYTSRGRTSESFQRGLDAIDNRDYESAIKYLNKDIQSNIDNETIFYSYFILGITYIDKSKYDYLGLFTSFNKEDVLKGIDCLNKSITLNRSGNFDNLNLDANFYIAKAYLLIDDTTSAKKHLQIVIDGRGRYYKKAEESLKIL